MKPSSRETILSHIGAAPGDCDAEYQAITRSYESVSCLDIQQRIEIFMERLMEYGARVFQCTREEIAATISNRLLARASKSMAVPSGLSSEFLPTGFHFVPDNNLTNHEFEAVDGAITGCAAAIADTGTIILDATASQGRRALTLLPDYHICLVFEDQVFATVPEAMLALSPAMSRPLTFVSGPSATADIEMTRIQGVHGPRSMDVILIRS